MSDRGLVYIVTAGDAHYPTAADGDWHGVFGSEEEALELAKHLPDDWVAVIEIDRVTLDYRVVRQRQA